MISDSYGVFVYDPDAGYARGFAASYDFEFYGWRNGVMVMRAKSDGTLFSCLSGLAFEGKRKGEQLKPIPTMMSTWGEVMRRNPNAVAYQMFEKYKPKELDAKGSEDSLRSQLAKVDDRLKPNELVLGVRVGKKTKAYPLSYLNQFHCFTPGELGDTKFVILGTSAYATVANQPRKWKGPNPDRNGVSPPDAGVPLPDGKELQPLQLGEFQNSLVGALAGGSSWDDDGRASDGTLKGWTLEPLDAVVCKWYAWSAEYPDTEVATNEVQEEKPAKPKPEKEELLRLLPKPYGTVQSVDAKARTVTLLLNGETLPRTWPLEPDAEVWNDGTWGRLEQIHPKDGVWVWLNVNSKKEPVSIALLADDISEQVIHDTGWTVSETERKHINEMAQLAGQFALKFTATRGKVSKQFAWESTQFTIKTAELPEKSAYLATERGTLNWYTDEQIKARQAEQCHWLRKQWRDNGLPGTVSFNHVFSGELDVVLDHEARHWASTLKDGDRVELLQPGIIKATVRSVTPWRERTVVRLSVGELKAAELKAGARIGLKMPWPAKEMEESAYPPDLGRTRTEAERIEWFLANIYCVCGVGNDTCTGHFYTLASCNPNGCGAPNATRDELKEQIKKGLSDKQIWDALLKDRGPMMLRPHLKP